MEDQLDLEKPIAELQNTLEELKKHSEKHALGISFEDEVAFIEKSNSLPRSPREFFGWRRYGGRALPFKGLR